MLLGEVRLRPLLLRWLRALVLVRIAEPQAHRAVVPAVALQLLSICTLWTCSCYDRMHETFDPADQDRAMGQLPADVPWHVLCGVHPSICQQQA